MSPENLRLIPVTIDLSLHDAAVLAAILEGLRPVDATDTIPVVNRVKWAILGACDSAHLPDEIAGLNPIDLVFCTCCESVECSESCEASQVLTMSEPELRAKLASEGHDFDQVASNTKSLLLSALMKASEKHFEQVDAGSASTCSECESPCELEDHCLDCGIAVCADCRGDKPCSCTIDNDCDDDQSLDSDPHDLDEVRF